MILGSDEAYGERMKLNSAPRHSKWQGGSKDDKSCWSEQEPARIGHKNPGTGENRDEWKTKV